MEYIGNAHTFGANGWRRPEALAQARAGAPHAD